MGADDLISEVHGDVFSGRRHEHVVREALASERPSETLSAHLCAHAASAAFFVVFVGVVVVSFLTL